MTEKHYEKPYDSTPSGLINIDWEDSADGTGMIKFNLFVKEDSVGLSYGLSRTAFYSRFENIGTHYAATGGDAKIIDFAKKGKIGKTKFDNWQKKKLKDYEYIGDWRCSYCNFKKLCFPNSVDPQARDSLGD